MKRMPVRDRQGTPVFVSVSNRNLGGRLTRDAIRDIVDSWLEQADAKEAGMSCHALRHSCGTILYNETKDLRAVQEHLGHSDPATTAKYAHVSSELLRKYTRAIPVKID